MCGRRLPHTCPSSSPSQSKANEERKKAMNEEKEIGIRTLAETVAANAGISRAEAHHVIRETIRAIRGYVDSGAEVKLREFGTFKRKHKPARNYYHPVTGAKIPVPAHDIPVFLPAESWRRQVRYETTEEAEK